VVLGAWCLLLLLLSLLTDHRPIEICGNFLGSKQKKLSSSVDALNTNSIHLVRRLVMIQVQVMMWCHSKMMWLPSK